MSNKNSLGAWADIILKKKPNKKALIIEVYSCTGKLLDTIEENSSFEACRTAKEASTPDKTAVITAIITTRIFMVYVNGYQITARI